MEKKTKLILVHKPWHHDSPKIHDATVHKPWYHGNDAVLGRHHDSTKFHDTTVCELWHHGFQYCHDAMVYELG